MSPRKSMFNIVTGVTHGEDPSYPRIGFRHLGHTPIDTTVYFNEKEMQIMVGKNRVYIPSLNLFIKQCTIIDSQIVLFGNHRGMILNSYYTNPRRISISPWKA